MVSLQEAEEMRDAIRQLEQIENQQTQAQNQANRGVALSWFNTQGINIQSATTRLQALGNFNQIKSLIQTETDTFRLTILKIKLLDANEKYKQVKKANP